VLAEPLEILEAAAERADADHHAQGRPA